jgi:hypothetical protein
LISGGHRVYLISGLNLSSVLPMFIQVLTTPSLKHTNLIIQPELQCITSGCGTPTENLSLFVEKYCKVGVDSIICRIRDTAHMLEIFDDLNEIGIQEGELLVSFDIINMFPSILIIK